MLSQFGQRAREKRDEENPRPVVFATQAPVIQPDLATRLTSGVPLQPKKPTLQQKINTMVQKDAPMSKLPERGSQAEVIARGGTIRAATPDPSTPPGRSIPFIGKVLFGRGYNKTYTPGTIAGAVEKQGAIGFLTEGFTSAINPSRERLGERIYERYSKLVEQGTDEQDALDKAVTDTVNRTLPSFGGRKRAVDELAKVPGSELNEDEEAALFWLNQREKLFAVLDAPIFVGSTKAVTEGAETVVPLVRDQVLERLKKPGQQASEIENRKVQSYVEFLEKKTEPSVSDLYRGVKLLETTGRPYEDLSEDLAKRTRESLFGPAQAPKTAPKSEPTPIVDPRLRTRVEVPMRDVAGNRFTVPPGTVLTPKIAGNKASFELDGVTFTVPKNQYDNLKGQSVREVAQPFAPELDELVETTRGSITKNTLTKDQAIREIANGNTVYGIDENGADALIEGLDDISRFDSFSLDEDFIADAAPTKYSKYTLPGAENYREILIQAPDETVASLIQKGYSFKKENPAMDGGAFTWSVIKPNGTKISGFRSEADAVKSFQVESSTYKSPHWDEPNVIAHIRANERIDATGQKHFFLEELQSDWARDVRAKGVRDDTEINAIESEIKSRYKISQNTDTWNVEQLEFAGVPTELSDRWQQAAFGKNSGGIVSNPALDNWQVTAIKRALLEAERSGADRFTWVNGAQTRERYQLSKEVDNISWGESTRGDLIGNKSISIKAKNGSNINFAINEKGVVVESISQAQSFVGKTIDYVLGKGMADRIMSSADGKIADEGLNIGGEWANNLYDRQVRDIVKKLTGAQIDEVDLGLRAAGDDRALNFTYADGRDVGGGVRGNVKKGTKVTDENGIEYVVTADSFDSSLSLVESDIYETAKNPKLISEDNLSWKIKTGGVDLDFGKGVFASLDEAIRSARRVGADLVNDARVNIPVRKENKTPTNQMSIRLTPEVISKIRSEAPDVTVSDTDARAYAGVPLIFTAFDQEAVETGIEASTGLPEGFSEDEEGNIVVDPKKAFLGMAAAGIIGHNFSREKGRLSSKQVGPDEVSSRPGQRELQAETPLPRKGQTQYPLSSSQFSDSLSKSYLETSGKTIDEGVEGLQPGAVSPEKIGQYSGFRKAIDDAWVSTVEALQDNLYRVRRLVQDPNVKVTDDTDPYLAELLFHGRVGARLQEGRDTFIKIDKDIIDTAKRVGVSDSDMTLLVNKFLHARHTPERNLKLGDGAAGLTNDEALSIIEDINALPYSDEVKRIADEVATMNFKTLEILRESQVLSEDAYSAMRTAYANHVPLQRVLKEDQDMVQALTGRGFDVKSTGIKRAKGSQRQVADILANVVTNYEQAIIRSEKNRVDLALLQFARDNQNLGLFKEIKPKAIGVKFGSDSLVVKPKAEGISDEAIMGENYELFVKSGFFLREESLDVAQLADNLDQMEVMLQIKKEALDSNPAAELSKFVARRGEFKGELPEVIGSQGRYTGRFSQRGDEFAGDLGYDTTEDARLAFNQYKAEKEQYDEMMKDYRRMKSTLTEITKSNKASEKAARAEYKMQIAALNKEAQEKWGTKAGDKFIYEQINDPRVLTLRENGKPVNLLIADEKLAVALKGINRQYLPSFMRFVGAFTRLYSGLQTRFNPEFAFPNKIRDLQEAVVYAGSRGELGFKGGVRGALDQRAYLDVLEGIRGADTEGARLYKQMIEDGGTTGGLSLSTREQVELDIAEIRKINRSNPRKAARKFIDSIDNFNTIFEDSTRLSLYKEALRRGVSRKRAAEIAKEASVNFNKFGTGGPVLNALWMFSNASIQGTTKMLRAMKNPKVAAAVSTAVGSAVWATGEWNDQVDPAWRDKVTAWDRTNALIVVLPPDAEETQFNYIAIPVGWGIKPIKVSMDYAYDAVTGNAKSVSDVMNGIGAAVVNSYNPIGGTDMFSAITPTILDLPAEIARNKAWHGGKIMPDWDANAPDSIRYFSNLTDNTTGNIAVQASEGLSGIGIEVSPASMYYAYQGYVGGAGRTATDVVNTMITLGRGELPEEKDIPVWSRFVKVRDNEEIGAASQEYEAIKEKLSEQSRDRFYLKQEAENSYQQLSQLEPAEAAVIFEEIAEKDPDLAKEIADIKAEQELGVTYTQRLIKQLGVQNGERAKFVYEKFNSLETDEEKAALWDEYVQKKIITEEVAEQLTVLVREGNQEE